MLVRRWRALLPRPVVIALPMSTVALWKALLLRRPPMGMERGSIRLMVAQTGIQVGTVTDISSLLLRSTDLLRFVPNGDNATTGNVTFRAWDQTGATSGQQGSKVDTSINGGTTAFSSATEVASITVTAVNDAPVLDAARSPVLLSVSEHAGTPVGIVGTLVANLVDFAMPAGQVDNVTDVDSGATTGIAITATNAVNGTWWYSTDNGSAWQRIGNVSNTNARLLTADASTRIYFEPTQSTEFSGTISNALTFRAWDGTTVAMEDRQTRRPTVVRRRSQRTPILLRSQSLT